MASVVSSQVGVGFGPGDTYAREKQWNTTGGGDDHPTTQRGTHQGFVYFLGVIFLTKSVP